MSMQGGIPHSNFTGLSQLMLGRVLLARGETEPAHRAFESAVTHLSSTVDANHPSLAQARELLAATAGTSSRSGN
jgi:predicted negative regulator of RcsB-dependent stress response